MRGRLIKFRVEAGYKTQVAFVEVLNGLGAGISLRRYRLIEQGKGKFTAVELVKIAEALKIDLNDLMQNKSPR